MPGNGLGNSADAGAAKSGAALPRMEPHQDADLVRVVEAWPTLSDDVRRQVLALIDQAERSAHARQPPGRQDADWVTFAPSVAWKRTWRAVAAFRRRG